MDKRKLRLWFSGHAILLGKIPQDERLSVKLLSVASGMTYVHTTNLLHNLSDLGLVRSKKVGRTRLYTLTRVGRIVSSKIEEIRNTLDLLYRFNER